MTNTDTIINIGFKIGESTYAPGAVFTEANFPALFFQNQSVFSSFHQASRTNMTCTQTHLSFKYDLLT